MRLTVTDSNSDQAVAFHFTSNSDGDDCIKCLLDESVESDSILIANNGQYVIYPNPSANEINVIYKTVEPNTTVSIVIFDYSGNVVFTEKLNQVEKGIFTNTIDVSSLVFGQYILEVRSGENSEKKRLLISN